MLQLFKVWQSNQSDELCSLTPTGSFSALEAFFMQGFRGVLHFLKKINGITRFVKLISPLSIRTERDTYVYVWRFLMRTIKNVALNTRFCSCIVRKCDDDCESGISDGCSVNWWLTCPHQHLLRTWCVKVHESSDSQPFFCYTISTPSLISLAHSPKTRRKAN